MQVQGTGPVVSVGSGTVQGTGDVRLEKACRDFEAIFLTMLWREMLKSTETDLGGWDTFAEQAIGQSWAKSGGIGLAKVIYRGMAKHLST
jgi:Rod binding domain-containing protein